MGLLNTYGASRRPHTVTVHRGMGPAATKHTLQALLWALSAADGEHRAEATHKIQVALTADLDHGDRVEFTDPRGKKRFYEVRWELIWAEGPTEFTQYAEGEMVAVDL